VQIPRYSGSYRVEVTAFDSHNDIAVLHVLGADPAVPLRVADPRAGTSVAILGYPENGPLAVTPGRIGRTAVVITQDDIALMTQPNGVGNGNGIDHGDVQLTVPSGFSVC